MKAKSTCHSIIFDYFLESFCITWQKSKAVVAATGFHNIGACALELKFSSAPRSSIKGFCSKKNFQFTVRWSFRDHSGLQLCYNTLLPSNFKLQFTQVFDIQMDVYLFGIIIELHIEKKITTLKSFNFFNITSALYKDRKKETYFFMGRREGREKIKMRDYLLLE